MISNVNRFQIVENWNYFVFCRFHGLRSSTIEKHATRKMGMPRVQDLIIISIFSIYFLLVYLTLWSIRDVLDASGNERHWTLGLFINLLGYAAIFVPGILILNFVKKSNYLEGRPHNFLRPLIQLCFFGSEETIQDSIAKDEARNNANLVFCFFGLQVSYLTMGILQEKIMTKTYEDSAGHVGRFKDSRFRKPCFGICCCLHIHCGLASTQTSRPYLQVLFRIIFQHHE